MAMAMATTTAMAEAMAVTAASARRLHEGGVQHSGYYCAAPVRSRVASAWGRGDEMLRHSHRRIRLGRCSLRLVSNEGSEAEDTHGP